MDTEQPSRHDPKYTFGAGGLFHAIRDLRDCQCLKGSGRSPMQKNPGSAIAKPAGADFVRSCAPDLKGLLSQSTQRPHSTIKEEQPQRCSGFSTKF